MDEFLQQFQHLEIQLEEIKSATDNFNDKTNCIGAGGFGKVYTGEVSHSMGRSMAAIKRLDPRHGQGIPEFLKEITTLSRYSHENLIYLLGYNYQGDDIILVYEHASHGSLDRHLDSPHLTWPQRLKICLDAAKGLSYLHDPRDTHQRLILCDVKSANILLDDQWNGKISDFGLSIMGPANEQQSVIVTAAVGTPGYYDPQYAMTHTLTKESDVYSFGVVLFEVLCGTLCCTYSNGLVQHILVPTWVESYKHKQLNNIIFKNPAIPPLDQTSLEIVSDIAYRCLKKSREDRPKMADVVTGLETALELQELSEGKLPSFIFESMTKTAQPPLNYSSKAELLKFLSKGTLLNGGNTWFSLNNKGEHYEMIALAKYAESYSCEIQSGDSLKFAMGTCCYSDIDWSSKIRVKTQFLTPGITYMVNLLFSLTSPKDARNYELISLRYQLQGETKTSTSYFAYEREDGRWMCELYQFTSDQRISYHEILLASIDIDDDDIDVEGIEFQPLEEVEYKDENQPISDPDANWEELLPTDYEEIIKWSKNSVQWTTKKEAYSIIRKGFLIDDGKMWFSLDKYGKKCHMISAIEGGISGWWEDSLFLPESRFGEAVEFNFEMLEISIKTQSRLLSSETTYATYLVYKFVDDKSKIEVPMKVEVEMEDVKLSSTIFLVSNETPVIRPKADQDIHNRLNKPKIKGLPQKRNDGWMEVKIWEFSADTTTKMSMFDPNQKNWSLIIEGIEFRPI